MAFMCFLLFFSLDWGQDEWIRSELWGQQRSGTAAELKMDPGRQWAGHDAHQRGTLRLRTAIEEDDIVAASEKKKIICCRSRILFHRRRHSRPLSPDSGTREVAPAQDKSKWPEKCDALRSPIPSCATRRCRNEKQPTGSNVAAVSTGDRSLSS